MSEELSTENSIPDLDEPRNEEESYEIQNDVRRNTAYTHALDLLKFEGEMLWSILSVFLVVNTILIGFIGQYISTHEEKIAKEGSWPCFIGSVMGLILMVPFYGTFLRNSQYYKFRMEQAKALEDRQYPLLRKDGKKFSKGKMAKANGKNIRLSWIGREMTNKKAASWMIFLFAFAYLGILFYTLPKFQSVKSKDKKVPIENQKTLPHK